MYNIVFETKPHPDAKQLDAECDRLERCVKEYALVKAQDEFKARQWLLSLFRRSDPRNAGNVDSTAFVAVLKVVNVMPSDVLAAHWVFRYDRKGNGSVDYKAFCGTLFGDVACQTPLANPSSRQILDRVRGKLLERGGGEMFGLSRVFRLMDKNSNQKLASGEFRDGLLRYGITLTDSEFKILYEAFDKNGDGIDVTEFLVALRGTLSDRRRKLVEMAFKQLDKDKSGIVEFSEICRIYDVSRHPDVVSKRRSPEAVLLEFIRSWDLDGDGEITLVEFLDYYKTISCSIDLDDYFELMIRNAWHLAGGQGWCANTTNLRVLVVHSDGTEEVVCLENDLGIRPKDTARVTQALIEQGVQDIARVAIAF